MENTPDVRTMSLLFRVEDWDNTARQKFMEAFTQQMEQLSPTIWRHTLLRFPRELGIRLEDNPGDDKLFRLSFTPGYEGGPLRVSLRVNVPEQINQVLREQAGRELEKSRAMINKGWFQKVVIPVLVWFFRLPDEYRQPEKFSEMVLKNQSKQVEEKISEAGARLWMGHASNALIESILISSFQSINGVKPGQAMPEMIMEANGRTIMVPLDGIRHGADMPADKLPRLVQDQTKPGRGQFLA